MSYYDVTVIIRIKAPDSIKALVKAEDLLAARDVNGSVESAERVKDATPGIGAQYPNNERMSLCQLYTLSQP